MSSDEYGFGYIKNQNKHENIPALHEPKIKMIDYDGEPVPEELCTVGRDGTADDFVGCGKCFELDGSADCENCIIDKLFKEYARLTNQMY